MRTITSCDVLLLGIELPEPFPLGFGILDSLPRVFLKVTSSDGNRDIVGIGEASIDFPFSDYDAWDIYWSLKNMDLVGRDIDDREKILTDENYRKAILMPFPAAFTALNMALDDLFCRYHEISVLELYKTSRPCGKPTMSLPFFADFGNLKSAIRDIHVMGGIPKLKVGKSLTSDLSTLLDIGAYLHENNYVCALDFNAQYSREDVLKLIDSLCFNAFDWNTVLFMEQPTTKAEGIDGLVTTKQYLLNKDLQVNIMADESFVRKEDALLCQKGKVLLNFKLHKIGGILIAREIENLLGDQLLPSMVGGTFPTAIGRVYDQQATAILHSASLPSDGWQPSSDYFTGDKHLINESFVRDETGDCYPIIGKGLGITPNWNNISKFLVENPLKEYQKIREGKTGEKISITLKTGMTYKSVYERLTNRPYDWNL